MKQYIRSGLLSQSTGYETIMHFDGNAPNKIVLVMEGKCRRKLQLGPRRVLYVNYHPVSFIGLEDYLLGFSRKGGIGAYPGAHYCIWQANDFHDAVRIYPELARRTIYELSRHIRIYDGQKQNTDMELRKELADMEIGDPETDISDILFDLSFSDNEDFPLDLTEKLARNFAPGEYLMKQGEKSLELYIIYSGKVDVFHNANNNRKKIDTLGTGELVGEMAQFDGLPRSADVVAVEDTIALVFLPENFSLLFQLHPRWSMKILNTLATRLEQRRKEFENIDLQNLRMQ